MASVHRLYQKPKSGRAKRELRSKFWYAKFRASDGRVVMRATKATERRKAEEIARQLERDAWKIREGDFTEATYHKNVSELLERVGMPVLSTVSTEKFFREWLQGKARRGSSQGTLSRYKPVVENFLVSLGDKASAKLATVSVRDVEKFHDGEIAAGKGPTTAAFGLSIVRSVFNVARRQGVVALNPAEQVEKVSVTGEERVPFRAEQVRALLSLANSEWAGAILFAYHCGIRLGDAAKLTWTNIDLADSTVTFRPQKTRDANAVITAVLHAELRDFLMQMEVPANDAPNAPLFPSLYGRSTGSHAGLSNEFTQMMRAAGIDRTAGVEKKGKGRQFNKLGFHSLRHSFISNLANADVSADVRREIAGHSSDQVHSRYVHLNLETQRRALSLVPRVRE